MANIQQIKLYTVDHDYGINPNPFWGFCTIGHCKPIIRKKVAQYILTKNSDGKAEEFGIWLVGVAAGKNIRRNCNCGGKVLYVMQVTEVLSYKDYWNDARFIRKRSDKLAYDPRNTDFRNCNDNIKEDVSVDCTGKATLGKDEYVLVSDNFVYWGNSCVADFGHALYGSKTGGGRYPIYYPDNLNFAHKMRPVADFINITFGEGKRADILGRPIMSADTFNLEEAVKEGAWHEDNTIKKRL